MKRKTKKYILIMIAVISCLVFAGKILTTNGNKVSGNLSEAVSDTDNLSKNSIGTKSTILTGTDDELIYCVGSVSKIYSTAAVMQLVDEGKVKLDNPVTDYIPDFKMADERYKDITVRMLMDHTSGIMGTTQKGDFLYGEANIYYWENLLNILATQRLKANPGEYAAYCNDGFDLLAMIVENVTDISYTDYIKKNIVDKTGGFRTETGLTAVNTEGLVPGTGNNNLRYENEFVMCLGAGGVYSTASDVANFGAGFFKNNNSILSEEAKGEMAKSSSSDEYMDGSGLGWDYAGMDKYEKAGVKFLAKGGDVSLNHAFLGVAPEENISIAVLTNGGSSTYNGSFALELLNIILEDKGIKIEEDEVPIYDTVNEIPEKYMEYEGLYTSADPKNGTASVSSISFPERKYMHVTFVSPIKTESKDYILTKDGSFVELAYEIKDGNVSDARISPNPIILKFVKADNGRTYYTIDGEFPIPSIGNLERKMYAGEKIDANPVSEKALNSWEEIAGTEFKLCSDLYSSRWFDAPYGMIYTLEGVDGYLYLNMSGNTRLLKIIDETHAAAFQSIPSSANRDLVDVTLVRDSKGTRMLFSTGIESISIHDISEFTGSVKSIELKDDEAKWFRIGDDLAGSDIIVDRPKGSSVFVFNRFSEMIYSTHVTDASPEIPLPKEGYILFLGRTGDKIEIQ